MAALAAGAPAQSCSAPAIAAGRTSPVVSANTLRISAKAWHHFERARSAAGSHQPELFERESALALAASPTFAAVYVLRAATQVRAGHYAEAIDNITAAHAIEPHAALADVVLASALTGLGRHDDAVKSLDRAAPDERSTWAWLYERTRAELGRRDAKAALHWSQLAADAAPAGCANVHLLQANALEVAGDDAGAIDQMRAFLAADPATPRRAEIERIIASLERAREAGRSGEKSAGTDRQQHPPQQDRPSPELVAASQNSQ